jgi:hypothetical protein
LLEVGIKLAAQEDEEGEGELADVFRAKDDDDLQLCDVLLHEGRFGEGPLFDEDFSILKQPIDTVGNNI